MVILGIFQPYFGLGTVEVGVGVLQELIMNASGWRGSGLGFTAEGLRLRAFGLGFGLVCRSGSWACGALGLGLFGVIMCNLKKKSCKCNCYLPPSWCLSLLSSSDHHE